ncbi:hypothetical protein QMO56_06110 [Roseomonas sp. E05]|uniref:hypothetical protein n=1 Tax=Roseomonas sp. E05 TaxID=3046310 RepID=UPI0024BBE018|nr:hypothetical protein [Roseomonas sp. E05]MDJ0387681.1 hypothetical protein [Roseomonas sp. E05]
MNELEMLREQIAQNKVRLGVDIRRMNAAGSPVYRAAETLTLPAAILVTSFLTARFVNIHVAALVLAVGVAWWLLKVQPKVKEGVFQRTADLAFSDERLFDGLWAKGILTLYAERPDGSARAATRKDDWRAFVRRLAEE